MLSLGLRALFRGALARVLDRESGRDDRAFVRD